ALVRLSASPALAAGDLAEFFREAARTDARVLGVARVGIWCFDQNYERLTCELLYELEADRFSSGIVFLTADHPLYCAALEGVRVVDADLAHEDPRTQEFATRYLEPHGIRSMCDAPLRIGGRVVGIVCHEHVGTPRTWTDEEKRFASSVADLV